MKTVINDINDDLTNTFLVFGPDGTGKVILVSPHYFPLIFKIRRNYCKMSDDIIMDGVYYINRFLM